MYPYIFQKIIKNNEQRNYYKTLVRNQKTGKKMNHQINNMPDFCLISYKKTPYHSIRGFL